MLYQQTGGLHEKSSPEAHKCNAVHRQRRNVGRYGQGPGRPARSTRKRTLYVKKSVGVPASPRGYQSRRRAYDRRER